MRVKFAAKKLLSLLGWFLTWGRSLDHPTKPASKPTLTIVTPESVNRTDPVMIPAAKWPAIRRRAQSPAWHAAMQQLREDVDVLLAQPWEVPTAPAGHFHQYFCPDHGVKLVFDPQSPTVHRCPVDGAILGGQAYDDAWRWFVNNRLSQGALRLAVLWQLEGNPAHAARVVDILTRYANRYTSYQTFPRSNPRHGIATFQTLDEATWLIPLTWAFDLTRDWMMAADAHTIIQQLLLPAANFLIERHPRYIHNYSCWHNAAIATVGVVTERRDLVWFAVDGEFGLETQLREGVLADGLWCEGSFSYHFYTLAAILMQLKATSVVPEFDLRHRPAVRAMFVAPIRSAYPDGTLPATNDCWYSTSLLDECCHNVPPAPAFYEIAYTWYGDDDFAGILQRAYQATPRQSLDALLYGAEVIPPAPIMPEASINLPASGYAILRTAACDATVPTTPHEQAYILLKYGPHGGGHGHPDKLNLVLYARDCRLSADLGTPSYGLGLFRSWYRHTVSHNTLTIDGCSQPPATGQLNLFRGDGDFQIADASVAWTVDDYARGDYAGVSFRRVLLARGDYFLDICLVSCDRPRQIDWIYHNVGELHTDLAHDAYADIGDNGAGYEHLADAQRVQTDDDLALTWQADDGGLTLFTAGARGTQLLTATSPSFPPSEHRATVINRRVARETAYLSVFHFDGRARAAHAMPDVRWIGRELLQQGWARCTVQTSRGLEHWLIRMNADVEPAAIFADESSENKADIAFEYCLRP